MRYLHFATVAFLLAYFARKAYLKALMRNRPEKPLRLVSTALGETAWNHMWVTVADNTNFQEVEVEWDPSDDFRKP